MGVLLRPKTDAEIELAREKLTRKYDLKEKRLDARSKSARARWNAVRSLKFPLGVAALAFPVWAATGFAGKTTELAGSLKIGITVGLIGSGWGILERMRSKTIREQLEELERELERKAEDKLGLPHIDPHEGQDDDDTN